MAKHHAKTTKRTMRAMQNMIDKGQITEATSCRYKTAYSQGGAHRALSAVRKRKRYRATCYHCRFCGHYHLTSVGAR